jgi:hypothetical protein
MTVLERIAHFQGRRDEVPNQELARDLARSKNRKGIEEIAANLGNKDRNVQSDCLKVLYEIGYLEPELIADHVGDFLLLLRSKNNRMVWGAMIAIATVSTVKPKEIWKSIDDVLRAVENGSLITVVWGVKALAGVASTSKAYRAKLFPALMKQLRSCIPRDLPTHAESVLPAIDRQNQAEFLAVLGSRQGELTASQNARLRKVLRQMDKP